MQYFSSLWLACISMLIYVRYGPLPHGHVKSWGYRVYSQNLLVLLAYVVLTLEGKITTPAYKLSLLCPIT